MSVHTWCSKNEFYSTNGITCTIEITTESHLNMSYITQITTESHLNMSYTTHHWATSQYVIYNTSLNHISICHIQQITESHLNMSYTTQITESHLNMSYTTHITESHLNMSYTTHHHWVPSQCVIYNTHHTWVTSQYVIYNTNHTCVTLPSLVSPISGHVHTHYFPRGSIHGRVPEQLSDWNKDGYAVGICRMCPLPRGQWQNIRHEKRGICGWCCPWHWCQ